MLFRISHELHYDYDRPVFLEPVTLRLKPRQDATQRLLQYQLRVVEPADGESHLVDVSGGDAVVLWFHQERSSLSLQVEMEVETLRANPFDWIFIHPPAARLPASYPDGEATLLAPACQGAVHPSVREWASRLADSESGSTSGFLMRLADEIHGTFHHVGRPEGEAYAPEQTLASRTGACRDTALLYVAACRSQGLAARFVSGYSMHHPPEVSEHELHAWAEVYLPGGGWRGYDPSLGLAVADGHVVLAAAADPRLAAPFTGHYRGTGVDSRMRYTVNLSVENPDDSNQSSTQGQPLLMGDGTEQKNHP